LPVSSARADPDLDRLFTKAKNAMGTDNRAALQLVIEAGN